jgi:hypothetical protein
MRIRLALFLLAFFAASVCGSAAAVVKVTDIQLQKNSQFTDVAIVCDGPAEVTHQIVEAAANKPYRIVIDVKNAVPALPVMAFKGLPSGSIKQIRSSQFATDPVMITRIVLDVTGALTYKVKADGNTFTLQINTPTDKNFPMWSATGGSAKPAPAVASAAISSPKPVATKPEVAKAETPKTMPAHPDKPGKPVVTPSTEPEKKDAKLANKPIDESKLLTKVNKPPVSTSTTVEKTPSAASNSAAPVKEKPTATEGKKLAAAPAGTSEAKSPAMPATQTTPGKADVKQEKAAKVEAKTPTNAPLTGETAGGKRADSITLPQTKPMQSAPAGAPLDMAKPPKVQKTALPETKVVKSPKYTESPEASNALTGKIATTLEGQKAVPAPAAADQQKEGASNGTALSRSEAVRQRYQAIKNGTQPLDAPSVDTTSMIASQTPKTEIDKIREKYKRGISFVQNDVDEQQQQATADTEMAQESTSPQTSVGPYSEFLPEREIVVYQAVGRPDPFMPLIEEATTSAKNGELPDVETLRLVGILQDKKTSRALFEDYNGYSFILRTGDRVKNGFVLGIEDTRVLFQIRQYGWNRQVALDLETEK